MKISRNSLDPVTPTYPVEKLGDPQKILFLDIETTGFTARSSYLYMIGCAYYSGSAWCTIQWMAESYEQEKDILDAFFAFAKDFEYLIHFNGNQFDLPFINQKCEQLSLPYSLEGMKGVDIYKRIYPYRHLLKLPNCKQKTIEDYLGVKRDDVFSGGELIGIYHDYVKNPTEFSRNSLLLHNEDDLKGMLQILPILSVSDMICEGVSAKKVVANAYHDYTGKEKQEILITLALPSHLPKPLSANANGCYFHADGSEGSLKVPLYVEELKYFYAGYQDYYYLPEEDLALHKSVATFVEKEHRTQATAATCYTRKQSKYLPQWEILFEPFFRRDYHGKELFFELTDEMKRNRDGFSQYANHVLSMIATTY